MNLSFIDKFVVIFRYIFSSFLSIEMFLMTLLLFFVLLVNLKRNNCFIQMLAIGIYLGFVLGILISYTSYVKTCIDSFVKEILNYISLLGGFCCTTICFLIPGWMMMKVEWRIMTKAAKIITAAGISILCIMGYTGGIQSVILCFKGSS